jgi:hypothetical protein
VFGKLLSPNSHVNTPVTNSVKKVKVVKVVKINDAKRIGRKRPSFKIVQSFIKNDKAYRLHWRSLSLC